MNTLCLIESRHYIPYSEEISEVVLRHLIVLVVAVFVLQTLVFAQAELRTRAEASNFEETSRYADVEAFISELQKRSPRLVRITDFGTSFEGRKLPLLVLSDKGIGTPAEARKLGRPVIFIMGNIHAGEVEGKEAVQHIARRLLFGDLKAMLSKMTILLAPIYNADGNEKIALTNRTAQNGPIGGVGVRENSQGFDLNRDYIKLESPEARSLVNLFNTWDPELSVDLHTTNGSYHAYHLTYSQPLNPNTDQRILDYQRDKMMPAIAAAMLKNHKFRTYYYGNFRGFANLPRPGETPRWEAFTHQPRIGQNYGGIRNRLTILSEAYSYLTFKRRVEVSERFVEEILKYVEANGAEIRRMLKAVDADTVKSLGGRAPVEMGVAFQPKALPKPVEILVGAVTKVVNPKNNREMTAMVEDSITPTLMEDFGMFAATRSVRVPQAYVFKYDKAIVDKLLQHGIKVEELMADAAMEVETFTVDTHTKAPRPFQGHNEARVTGKYSSEKVNFPSGTVIVRTAQPLGRLVFYLLEPESDDGLGTWNFFDPQIAAGQPHPVRKLMVMTKISLRKRE